MEERISAITQQLLACKSPTVSGLSASTSYFKIIHKAILHRPVIDEVISNIYFGSYAWQYQS